VGYSSGEISKCYATGSAIGTQRYKTYVGGLLGHCDTGIISNSYATGSVTGNQNVGGLVGHGDDAKAANSYATGFLTGIGDSYVDGIWGRITGCYTIDCYYDSETTGRPYELVAIGKKTKEMMMESTYKGWDFKETWEINEGLSYPNLR